MTRTSPKADRLPHATDTATRQGAAPATVPPHTDNTASASRRPDKTPHIRKPRGTTRRLPAAHIIQTSQEGMQAECAPPVSQVIDNQHSYKTCRFSLQNGTFRAVKRHVSGCQTAHIANQAHKSWHCVRVQHSKRHAIISATAWQSQRTESTWPQRKPNRAAPQPHRETPPRE